jgi:hypothetical protein
LNRLDAAAESEPGRRLRRVIDLRAASRLGIHVGIDEVTADEFHAMLILDKEQRRFEGEQRANVVE